MNKQTRNIIIVVSAAGVLLLVGVALLGVMIVRSGITAGPDKMFGDQHLKTSVALIELHKVRTGKYPKTLKDIEFTGQWDGIALSNVSYRTNSERSAYYVEVQRGWVGKPTLKVPKEFWVGTGYDPSLRKQP